MNIEVIIPIFNLSRDRLRNFSFILSKLTAAGLNITVVEQYSHNIQKFKKHIKHIIVNGNRKEIEKCKLINKAVADSKSEYVWVHDADIYFPFRRIFNKIKKTNKLNAIKPFVYFSRLNNDETIKLISEGSIKDVELDIMGSDFGAASFIVKRNIFNEIDGMNERFIGWGHEDIEFGFRISRITNIDILPYRALHLYHKPMFGSNINREKINISIYRETVDNYWRSNVRN